MSTCLFILFCLFFGFLSPLVRVCGIFLALECQTRNPTASYCSWTFALLPWFVIPRCQRGSLSSSQSRFSQFMRLSGLFPLGRFLDAIKLKLISDDDAFEAASDATRLQLVEIFCGALPQLALHLYYIGYDNAIDNYVPRVLCIGVVAIFVAYGACYSVRCAIMLEDENEIQWTVKREFVVSIVFVPWTLLYLVSCVSVCLASSLFSGRYAGYVATISYYFINMMLCGLAFPFQSFWRKSCGSINFIFGLIYAFASFSFSSFWFVGIVSLFDPDKMPEKILKNGDIIPRQRQISWT